MKCPNELGDVCVTALAAMVLGGLGTESVVLTWYCDDVLLSVLGVV